MAALDARQMTKIAGKQKMFNKEHDEEVELRQW